MIIRFLRSLKKSLPVVLLLLAAGVLDSYAQDCSIPIIVDFRESPNMTTTIRTKRRGDCCGDKSCVTFKVLLNPEADLLNFVPKITGSAFYSIDCGPLLPSNQPACLAGGQDAILITFCKPGSDPEDYVITTSRQVQASGDLFLRQGCSGLMSVQGFYSHPESITWTSIYPDAPGAYNSYLSCSSGCNITTVSPLPGAPPYIDYKVTGTANACSDLKSDTVRVYTTPPLTIAMTPETAVLCANGSGSTVLSAVPAGGSPPYSYSWSTGQNTASISVSSPGSYSVTVSDNTTNCPPVVQTVEVAAIPTPPPPVIEGMTICSGNNAVLTPASPGGTYQWFSAATDGILLYTGNSYTTPTLNSSTTYYVQTTVNGCTSERVPVTVNVLPTPAAPVAQGTVLCSNNAVSLKASGSGGNFEWFDVASGGTPIGVGPTFNTPVLHATTSYYVQATLNGCSSTRTKVTVAIKPVPSAPAVAGTSICAGNAVRLTATGPGGNYEWYDAAIGGQLLATNADFTTPVLNTTVTYYVQTTINGCTSARTAVTVTVNPVPASPGVSGVIVCQNTSATLAATGATGTLNWYDAPAGGNLLHSGNIFTSPPLSATTTFYVDDTSISGCTSQRTAVTATVLYPDRPAFLYSSGTYCISGFDPVPTIMTPAGGTFSAGPGLVIKDPATGEIDLSESSYGVYTITFVDNTPCHYVSTATITITSTPDATFSYSSVYCKSQGNALPAFPAGSSAGIFSAQPGLVFLNTSTGEIDLRASAPGSYTVTNTIAEENGCSRATFSQTLTIYEEPIVNAGADVTICSGDLAPLMGTMGGGATTAVWSGGLGTFSDAASLHTTYTPAPGETDVVLTLTTNDPSGPCDPKASNLHVWIKPKPYITSDNSNTICNDEPVKYTITSNINGATFTWSRAAVAGIDNPATNGAAGSVITEVLHNTTPSPIEVPYQIIPSFNGCDGSPFTYTVTVNPTVAVTSPATATVCNKEPLNYTITSNVSAATFRWSRESVPGISNASVTERDGNTINEVLENTTSSYIVVSYEITPEAYGCTGSPFTYTVTVKPSPAIINKNLIQQICSGESSMPINLTSSIEGTTYQWTAIASAGIQGFQNSGNGDIPAQRLINQGTTTGTVEYNIIPYFQGCRGETTNYIIKVYPLPARPSATSNSPVCEGSELKLSTPGAAGASYYWTGPNGFSSNQQNPKISRATTAASGVYTVSILSGGCMSETRSITVLVNRIPDAPAAQSNSPLCEGNKLILSASTIPGASYVWSGPNGFSSTLQNPEIANAGIEASGVYSVLAIVNGCPSHFGTTTVKVNSVPSPVVSSNSPVCTGSDLFLEAEEVEGANFHWAGPDGFSSDQRKPVIRSVSKTNAGNYSVTVSVNGCTPVTKTLNVVIGLPSVAVAGPDQTMCAAEPSIPLGGNVTGGSNTGQWRTTGTGYFSPSNTDLQARYYPSEADIAMGSVQLTLESTNNECSASESSLTLTIVAAPTAAAGPDQEVCADNPMVQLNGVIHGATGGSWSTSGTGSFSPSASSLKAVYIPGKSDIASGKVQLRLTSTGNPYCTPASDAMDVIIASPPALVPNLEIFLLEHESTVLDLHPTGEDMHFRWYPADFLNDATIKAPTVKGVESRVYTLTVTGKGGCVTTGKVEVKVLKPIKIPNVFTPNGDGINDVWNINALSDYPDVSTSIFNRYGTKVYSSKGYDHPWDGTCNGTPVPVGTYYYVIEIKSYNKAHSGFISVIR